MSVAYLTGQFGSGLAPGTVPAPAPVNGHAILRYTTLLQVNSAPGVMIPVTPVRLPIIDGILCSVDGVPSTDEPIEVQATDDPLLAQMGAVFAQLDLVFEGGSEPVQVVVALPTGQTVDVATTARAGGAGAVFVSGLTPAQLTQVDEALATVEAERVAAQAARSGAESAESAAIAAQAAAEAQVDFLAAPADTQVAAWATDTGAATGAALADTFIATEPEELLLYVTPRGDDANSGLTPRSAKASIGGAFAAGATKVLVGAGTIVEPAPLIIPAQAVIVGAGKRLTTLTRGHGGDFATLGSEAYVEGLTIDGLSLEDSARGLVVAGTVGRQELLNVAILNFDGPCLDFGVQAGSQFRGVNVDVYRRASGTGTDRYAVNVNADTAPTGAVPRSFVNLQSQGGCAINFGGCDNFYVVNSTLGDLRFSDNSRAVNITGSRLLNQMALTVRGHGNSIVACDINAQVSIAAGSDNITLGPGAYNRLPVLDSAGNARNNVTHWLTDYAPVLTSGGTAPSLGDGTLTGLYSRSGAVVHGEIVLTVGSTTVLGTGELRFSLPVARSSSRVAAVGEAIISSGAATYLAIAQATAPGYLRLWEASTRVLVTHNQPVVLAAGSTIRIAFSYHL